jgi:hypothetical protein
VNQRIVVDPDSKALQVRPALIHTKRRNRKRFPEGCVTLMDSDAAALAQADNMRDLLAAMVYGPSVSSENQRIYYLVKWLD